MKRNYCLKSYARAIEDSKKTNQTRGFPMDEFLTDEFLLNNISFYQIIR